MKKEYDFTDAERGRFFCGTKPLRVVVNVSEPAGHSRFEVYSDTPGEYRFRLAIGSNVIFTSEHDYGSKDDCLAAISLVRQDSIISPTVFS